MWNYWKKKKIGYFSVFHAFPTNTVFLHNTNSPILVGNIGVSKENQRSALKNSRSSSLTVSVWLIFPGKHPRQHSNETKTFFSVTLRLLGLSQMDKIGKSEIQARPTQSLTFGVSLWNSRNTEVKLIILFIIYKLVSPGRSRVEIQVFRSTYSIQLLVVSAGFQSYEMETQMSQAPELLWKWNNSPSLSEVEDICHSRQIFMPQLAVEGICIHPSMDPKILFSCL